MKAKILILGATGMLGHVLFKHFFGNVDFDTYATVRSRDKLNPIFSHDEQKYLIEKVDAFDFNSISNAFNQLQPDIVINCIGIIKQSNDATDHYTSISINSLLPHQIAKLCASGYARLIHISTDCVFDGKTGNYVETDNSNATDLYGKTKFLGEVNYPHAITLRTSIIGHELFSKISLVDWFLSQSGSVNGYTNAIFSGVTTYQLAEIIEKYVLPNPELHGLYHVSIDPISKYDLLKLIAKIYHKNIEIQKFADFYINRVLNSDRFRSATSFKPIPWSDMIEEMYSKYISCPYYHKY